ncbi:MAG: hypothetical protein ACE5EV_00535, partial [Gaiellales bacterium]
MALERALAEVEEVDGPAETRGTERLAESDVELARDSSHEAIGTDPDIDRHCPDRRPSGERLDLLLVGILLGER